MSNPQGERRGAERGSYDNLVYYRNLPAPQTVAFGGLGIPPPGAACQWGGKGRATGGSPGGAYGFAPMGWWACRQASRLGTEGKGRIAWVGGKTKPAVGRRMGALFAHVPDRGGRHWHGRLG